MCGIAGFVTLRPGAYPESVLRRMTAAIAHRGPDAEGFYQDEYAALGHRRLSIIDVAGGRQPMSNESGDVWIIYNGEVFNHADLRPELEAAGHRYETHCDTETIVHAYEQYGASCLDRFRGMYAFAIWDPGKRRLFCARDRLGKKPLYYYWNGETFVFGSEIKALLQHPVVSARFEESLLPEYLAFGYTSDDRTLFQGIRKLMPGHHLTLTPEGLDIRSYWELTVGREPAESQPDEYWIGECRRRLEETVRMRLMSDVPLGMFLSGGVDSSAIAALMKRMADGPVKSFAVGYAEQAYSELGYARQVSEAIGTQHREVVVGMEDFFDALPRLIWHEDEPIVWPSSVSLHFVSRLAAEEVKVVLTGEGSDEMFAGYGRYRFYEVNQRWLPWYLVLPQGVRRAIRSQVASSRLLNGDLRRKLQHSFLGREPNLESLYLDNFFSALSEEEQQSYLAEGRRFAESPYGSYLRYWKAAGESASLLARMLYADQKTYLVELLMKQDQMSMSCSLESRVPFLDHRFVEFSTRVPDRLKLHQGTGKYILKKAVEDLLPHEIIYRKKMGFPTPLRAWLRTPEAAPLLNRLLDREGLLARYVRPEALQDLLSKHRDGREDGTDRLWRLLNLQLWGEVFLKGNQNLIHDGWAALQGRG
jgi:asparagine synthase (glutamine-hydrolysing)